MVPENTVLVPQPKFVGQSKFSMDQIILELEAKTSKKPEI